MSLMTSIYTGVTGLRSSQNAINITSHNIANINTEGYVRQQATFADYKYQKISTTPTYSWQVGIGVYSDDTQHLRDYFLDLSYRQEVGRENFYSAQYTTVEEIETVFGELEGEAFQNSMVELKEAIAELSKTPDSIVAKAGLVMCAEEFINRSNAIYEDLISYQQNLNVKINNTVNRINELGLKIQELNYLISGFEASGFESANDLRDQRDLAIDELSGLVGIQYEENPYHVVTIKIEGVDFVTETTVFQMGTAELDGAHRSTYLSAVWPHLENKEVFYFANEVSTEKGNDLGELKGLLMSRGDYVANYTDIPDENADNYDELLEYYRENVDYSSIMKTQAMFDKLVNGIVTSINDILCPETTMTFDADTTFTLEDGTVVTYGAGETIKVLDMEKTSYGNDVNKTPGNELFARCDAERYTKAYDAQGNLVYIYNETNEFGDLSLYTLGNIQINENVLDDYSYLPFTDAEGDTDYDKAFELLEIWDVDFGNLNPDNLTDKTFMEFYNSMTSEIANIGYLYNEISVNQATVVDSVNNARWSKYGVSSDEELSLVIKYQNAYNANSRYVTAIADMIEHIINTFGA
ncbi:MAG: flagellar hook-associated protein FlgK [Lachnospiraceae bacterium]|nr:flagellar hook-associated protein FlgK [Lachnospiraceae bacterium]